MIVGRDDGVLEGLLDGEEVGDADGAADAVTEARKLSAIWKANVAAGKADL